MSKKNELFYKQISRWKYSLFHSVKLSLIFFKNFWTIFELYDPKCKNGDFAFSSKVTQFSLKFSLRNIEVSDVEFYGIVVHSSNKKAGDN